MDTESIEFSLSCFLNFYWDHTQHLEKLYFIIDGRALFSFQTIIIFIKEIVREV